MTVPTYLKVINFNDETEHFYELVIELCLEIYAVYLILIPACLENVTHINSLCLGGNGVFKFDYT